MIGREMSKSIGDDATGSQRGAVLLLVTLGVFVLLGMAAFTVDFGWLYYNQLQERKAAEAAALAGVVHMPLPTSLTFGPGTDPYDTAMDIAERNGYASDGTTTVTPLETPSPAQLRVEITRQVDTFFMRAFGIDTATVSAGATAEQLPPLKIGSDESSIGGAASNFWVAINGERRRKEDGDPFATRCLVNLCGGTTNAEFRDPAYYFAVEVDPAHANESLVVQVWDGTHMPRNTNVSTGESGGADDLELRWRLYAPDETPNNWLDNSTLVCTESFYRDGQGGRPAGWGVNEWRPICGGVPAVGGIYVLELSVHGQNDELTAFQLGATVGGGGSGVAVYGLGDLSLWMNFDDTTPTFKIVRLDPVYAGTQLILSLFDPGDISGSGHIEFTGAMSGMDCQVRVHRYNDNGGFQGTTAWMSDGAANPDGDWAGSNCGLTSSGNGGGSKIYNNDWVELMFDIPPDHTCSGSACWANVEYTVADPTERTTWSARINGTPIHLEP